ncbi:hypothetical protein P4T49_22425 [Bacillus paranthracis]|uniref:hypothetical protein n=1 Tax=Bacillus paranthracis TaxID=2026186 RepID=UPI000AC656B5|nr:hypothetical protein [Bacillus paranthracis]MED0977892.1 hypothetical protein [Bacillus paranthracis]MED1138911.1 hypothetical protein [Bacillus paranthracis]
MYLFSVKTNWDSYLIAAADLDEAVKEAKRRGGWVGNLTVTRLKEIDGYEITLKKTK